ncbi:hypothetical protein R1flu_024797 [Riccia fluitans]|uniref:Secreted protein n=1 Tax=Riccia fluitans TaxID=41844 RepID=A0ABD1XWC7_9MARC
MPIVWVISLWIACFVLWKCFLVLQEVAVDAANAAMESFEEQGIPDTQGVDFAVCPIMQTALRTPTCAPLSLFQGAAANLMIGRPLPEWRVPPIADRAVPTAPNFQLRTSLPSSMPPPVSYVRPHLEKFQLCLK